MFQCSLCEICFSSVTAYWKHCCKIHSNIPKARYQCGVKNCLSSFSSLTAIRQHVTRFHSDERQHSHKICTKQQSEGLLCPFQDTCVSVTFPNVKTLVSHLNGHIRTGKVVQCPFEICTQKYNFRNESSFKSHISRRHHNSSYHQLSTAYSTNNFDEDENPNSDPFLTSNSCNIVNRPTCSAEESENESDRFSIGESDQDFVDLKCLEKEVEKNLALLYLKLQSKHHVPNSVIQTLIEELNNVQDINQEIHKSSLNQALLKINLPREQIASVIKETENIDIFKKCHGKNGALRTNFSRERFYKENFHYVQPVEVYLGLDAENKDSICHYIPVLKSLQAIFHDSTVKEQYLHPEQRPENGELHDFTDGKVFKSNALFKEKPSSLQIILYQDSFEVVNPLGSAKKKHKILATYFILGNLRSFCRSKIDPVQLVLLCRESYFNYFGHEKVFRSLLNDLKHLENYGIELAFLGLQEKIYGTVVFIAGDNLGSHSIGGFLENFSTAHYKCRYCLATTEQLTNAKSVFFGEKRDIGKYKAAVDHVEQYQVDNFQGVKFNSVFNQLSYFHVCNPGLPPCLAHDLLEGILHYDLALYFTYFISTKKWFSWEYLSRKFSTYKFLREDSHDKPNTNDIKKGNKVGGQALQTWCLLRFTPLLLRDKIDDTSDLVWQNIILLQKIVQFVLSPKISSSQVCLLSNYIQQYIEVRLARFPDERLKPKHHYLSHYPELILNFGPLVHAWTMRFESKHSYFKKCARHCQNFRNITKTLSHRHQLLQAYYSAGHLFAQEVDFSDTLPFSPYLFSTKVQALVKNTFSLQNTEINLVDEVNIRGTRYRKDSVLILYKLDYNLIVGKIAHILITAEKEVYFIVNQYLAMYVADMNFYEIQRSDTEVDALAYQPMLPFDFTDMACVSYTSLEDYVCHEVYHAGNKMIIVRKHA